jgi:hypothetical protein
MKKNSIGAYDKGLEEYDLKFELNYRLNIKSTV